jgi:phenylacetic acid degradation operon negative regulatory protein
MKRFARANMLLEVIFWGLEILARPTIRNLTESFEGWEYRQKIRPQLRSLVKSGFIEFHQQGEDTVVAVTQRGRMAATGGIDPEGQWERTWDGTWHLLVFDLPGQRWDLRQRLWRWLRSQRFGYLQQSGWITPDPVDDSFIPLKELKLSPESYLVIEGRPKAPDTDADLVAGAWDFVAINRAYQRVLEVAERVQKIAGDARGHGSAGRTWLGHYRLAWLEAMSIDPLLPKSLWPVDYLGEKAWRQRQDVLKSLVAV